MLVWGLAKVSLAQAPGGGLANGCLDVSKGMLIGCEMAARQNVYFAAVAGEHGDLRCMPVCLSLIRFDNWHATR